jgi:hypothetical protein
MRSLLSRSWLAPLGVVLAVVESPVFGNTVIITGSTMTFTGTATGTTGPVAATALFSVDQVAEPGILKLVLTNNTSPTLAPSDLLTSFYFNVSTGTGTLNYYDAKGFVYYTSGTAADAGVIYTPPLANPNNPLPSITFTAGVQSNLMALANNFDTWQFKSGLSLVVDSSPILGFGVGTVGNSSLGSNGFNGNVVDGFNFGIYTGDVTTQSLSNNLFVKDSITFKFSGFAGSIADITPHAVFGFGTNPDTIVSVPEPSSLLLASAGVLAGAIRLARRRESRQSLAAATALS